MAPPADYFSRLHETVAELPDFTGLVRALVPHGFYQTLTDFSRECADVQTVKMDCLLHKNTTKGKLLNWEPKATYPHLEVQIIKAPMTGSNQTFELDK
ncbi:hypothetical protein RUM43_004842 [Polyplax serrata]|uniref:Uncharacterized protein n=1 Tax=Polyplax serrata TaxID=468196 RepID=A0AAN8SBD7_POLSC